MNMFSMVANGGFRERLVNAVRFLLSWARPTPDGQDRHRQQSMVLVPRSTPGVIVKRNLTVMGYVDNESHCEVLFENVRVPVSNLLGEEGSGFALAQARLGPGRIHHCMRSIGVAQRALELMCQRAATRVAFGKPLAEQGIIQDWIAQSQLEIEQARLLTLKTAWMIDTLGKKAAYNEIAMIKIVVPEVHTRVVDRAMRFLVVLDYAMTFHWLRCGHMVAHCILLMVPMRFTSVHWQSQLYAR